jgi:predicted nucleic acid-binding Zn ribbon protein
MEFLLVFGLILLLITVCVRPHLQWNIDENACNMKQERKAVKTNRMAWYGMLTAGIILILIYVISVLI